MMIQLEEITVKFNAGTPLEKIALQGISIAISEGEFVTVIGGNGAGKSTLLSVLSGDKAPLSGRVLVDQTDVTTWPTWKRAPFIARVFQDPMAGTCASLSIEENLALASCRSTARGLERAILKEERERFREKLARLGLGLENRLSDPMGSLSGGQRQAISLVMSTLQPMKILVLDEHTAALDPKTAAFVMELTQQIVSENNLTTLMVTHSMHQALHYGTRTLMLSDGQVMYDACGTKRKNLKIQDLLDLFSREHMNTAPEEACI